MGTSIKAVFGFGTLLEYEQAPWMEESFEEFDNDFLEWVSQQISHSPDGKILNASTEEREQFANTLPVNFIQALNSHESYLLLTKFFWLLEQPKHMKVDLNLDEFNKELTRAREFCNKVGVSFEYTTGWLLGILYD